MHCILGDDGDSVVATRYRYGITPARRASLPSFRRSLLARSIIRTDELLGLKDKVGSSLAALLVRLGVSHSARDCGQKEGLKGEGEGEGGAPCSRGRGRMANQEEK